MSFTDQLSHYTPKPYPVVPGDFYVSPQGSDAGDGSFDRPFATLGRAIEAVRSVKERRNGVTVCVRAGVYPLKGLRLDERDTGRPEGRITYRAYGDGEVILDGGVTLDASGFRPVSGAQRERLDVSVRDRVVEFDLKSLGLTPDDWGPLYPIGAFGTEHKYDSYVPGENCELFVNGKRMTLARYPSEGFLRLSAVADVGDCWEFPEQNYHYDWNDRRNHRGGAYIMDKETTARLKGWKSLEGVWCYGYFYHDWADSSSPVSRFDLEHRTLYPAYVSRYGARKDALYYLYNALEALDSPGEWYLDRETGMLYLYPPTSLNDAQVEITLTTGSLIQLDNVRYVTFEGFTLRGARGDAIVVRGSDNTLRSLSIYAVRGHAAVVEGYRNIVFDCVIAHTGRGGIVLSGGDRDTLTPGGNRAENNLIHDWAEVYMTYNPGVRMEGVGQICAHNEMYNAPHSAVIYAGNDHIVEYNVIHDVVTHSSDAGAIYAGGDWAGQGSIVRYNCVYDIGGEGFTPDGIYFDDMLSGQSAYGNLVVNVRKNGFLIGGGRDNVIRGNVVINCGTGIKYDDRGRDAFVRDGWAKAAVADHDKGVMWQRLRQVPYRLDTWARRYPSLARISEDFSAPDDPDFPVNPAHNKVTDNIVIDKGGELGEIRPDVYRYSDISSNVVFTSEEAAGFSPDTFRLTPDAPARRLAPGFEDLPLEKMGRI